MRTVLQRASIAVLCLLMLLPLPALPAQAAEKLVIGRLADSLISDIGQRVVSEALRRSGIELEIRPLPQFRSLALANDGAIDGDLDRIAEVVERYPNLMIVPTAIVKSDVAIYSASPDIAFKSRADVMKMSVIFPRGTLILQKFSKGMPATEAVTRAAAAEMAINHRVDLLMGVHIDVESDIAAGRLTGLYPWPRVWESEALYMVLNRRHATLAPRIDAVFQQMRREGLIDKYYVELLRNAGVRPLAP